MKKIIAFLLVLSAIFALCACDGDSKKATPDDGDLSLVDKNGKAQFMIISYSGAPTQIKSVVQLLSSELRKNAGGVFRVSYTSANKDDKNSYEFLIGATGREESVILAEGIAENEYRVKVMGRKIVVVAGNDIALSRAIGELLGAIDYEKKIVPKTLNISGKVGGEGSLLVGMANQSAKRVEVYDISSGDMHETSLVWSAKTSCSTISGFKFRNHDTLGEVVLVIGGAIAEIIDYDTKDILWRVTNSSENGHSLELLPNGVIVTGGTVGNALHFYNINGENPSEILLEIPFPDAHGLLWDPKNQVVWAAGKNQLTAFEVTLNADGSVTATVNEALSYVTPEGGLHDLQPYYGNEDYLLISTASHVYIYDKVNKTVKDAYEGVAGATTDHVKGVGRFLNGDQIYMFYDGGNDNGQGGGWNTTYLTYVANGAKIVGTIPSNMGRFYKCRVWYSDYQ